MQINITILGKVPKGDDIRESFVDWKEEYIAEIRKKLPNANILHGDHIRDDVGSVLVVGHDLWTVKNADLVIVDARAKIGAGTAQEMLMAKYFKVPVIAVIPKDTHHRRTNLTFNGVLIEDWIHPFLDVSSDYVVENAEGAVAWAKDYVDGRIQEPVKNISVFEEAIALFEKEFPQMVASYKSKQ